MKKLLVILGPTATGKTDLALNLAKKFNGELVACDSRQVYKGLDIGTGKLPSSGKTKVEKHLGVWGIGGINIWMYDLLDPTEQFNAFDWAQSAIRVIRDIWGRGKLPIIVGGTGLYLKAFLEGLDDLPSSDQKLRTQLEKLSLDELQSRVVLHSPARWEKLNNSDKNNPRRLIRIIEQVTMYPYTEKYPISNIKYPISNVLKIGLTAPRPDLNTKIDQRVFDWINLGIIDEVKGLVERGVSKQRFEGFGLDYKLVADFLDGKISTKDELIKLMQTKVKQYAKRQMTWFKKEKGVNWFDITTPNWSYKVESEARNWYNTSDDRKN